MQRGVHVRNTIGHALLASLLACAPEYQAGPRGSIKTAAIVDVHPDRPRYRYRLPAGGVKLHAHRVELVLVDGRSPERVDQQGISALQATAQPVEVSAHGAFRQALEQRLALLIDADPGAPLIKLEVQIVHVLAWRGDARREISATLNVALEAGPAARLTGAHGHATHTLLGPPYDASELDDVHLGTCLEAFDAALPPSAIEDLNALLRGNHASHGDMT